MPSFRKPIFSFNFDLNDEIQNLLNYKTKREIPEKSDSSLLFLTVRTRILEKHKNLCLK